MKHFIKNLTRKDYFFIALCCAVYYLQINNKIMR